jgi:hypothetical protein
MRRIARLRIAILALMLTVSHVALVSHVTAHFASNLDQCELCVSQAQLLSAIPSSEQVPGFESGAIQLRWDSSGNIVPCLIRKAYHQRAPPILSA